MTVDKNVPVCMDTGYPLLKLFYVECHHPNFLQRIHRPLVKSA